MPYLNQLFNCLRPDPPSGYGCFDEPEPEIHECDYCHEQATRSVTYKKKFDDGVHTKHDYICDDCYGIEFDEYEEKEINNVTKL